MPTANYRDVNGQKASDDAVTITAGSIEEAVADIKAG